MSDRLNKVYETFSDSGLLEAKRALESRISGKYEDIKNLKKHPVDSKSNYRNQLVVELRGDIEFFKGEVEQLEKIMDQRLKLSK